MILILLTFGNLPKQNDPGLLTGISLAHMWLTYHWRNELFGPGCGGAAWPSTGPIPAPGLKQDSDFSPRTFSC